MVIFDNDTELLYSPVATSSSAANVDEAKKSSNNDDKFMPEFSSQTSR